MALDPKAATIKERCKATDGAETAAEIVADIRSRLAPGPLADALVAFRSFHASWEGSIIVAIGTYLEAAPSGQAPLGENDVEKLVAERDEARQSWADAIKLYEMEVARVDPALSALKAAESLLAEAREALEQRDAELDEFMRRLDAQWFLAQSWFPESVNARVINMRKPAAPTEGR